MSDHPRQLVDEHGVLHELMEPPLGEGGQGAVYRTASPEVVVKLLRGGESEAQPETGQAGTRMKLFQRLSQAAPVAPLRGDDPRRLLRRRLEVLRTLPLPEDLHLARPQAMLRDYAGYTMRLLRGMVPIRHLISPPGCTSQEMMDAYVKTGGLRRRLSLLASCAETLARLHAVPLVYCDTSPNNIFISEEVSAEEVWLIDADNLHFQSGPGPAVYTPGFGAPEVAQGRSGATTLSDAYAFSVLAYWVLTQVHPFMGDALDEGGWEESGEDMEQQAYDGKLPWIHDEQDDSNYSEVGIFPRELVISPRLTQLFALTFGPGRLNPTARPGMLGWVEALHQAADMTLTCQNCGSTYFVTAKNCPFQCGAHGRPQMLYIQVRRWDPGLDSDDLTRPSSSNAIWHKVLDHGELGEVRRHVLAPTLFRDGDPVVLELEFLRNGVRLRPLTDMELWLGLPDRAEPERLNESRTVPVPVPGKEWQLHCGALDRPHRVASFSFFQGGR